MKILNILWGWIFSCALAATGRQELRQPAFCRSSKNTSFPTRLPEAPHLPWIWDVVYDPYRLVVEISSVSRQACKVNITRWQEITQLYPQLRDQLADGDTSNILATSGDNIQFDFIGSKRPKQGILGKTVSCVYYAMDGSVISKLQSHVVYSAWAWAHVGPLLIRCPVPSSLRHQDSFIPLFDRVAIERELPAVVATTLMDGGSARWQNRTLPLPFCSIPYIGDVSSLDNDKREYKLSICTTAQRPERKYMIEWIEYHLLLGFEHFFIYDTGILDEAVSHDHSRKQNEEGMNLENILKDYEDEGVVTIVS